MKIEINRGEIDRVLKNNKWDFGNKVLYNMCKENPHHDDPDIIVGKVWIIGRSYAAAIERRKKAFSEEVSNDFYYEVVAPNMLKIGNELDERIDKLSSYENCTNKNVNEIISLHKFLMDNFNRMTGMDKRSLASKYLHFHLPKLFYIFDLRAEGASSRLCKANSKELIKEIESMSYDQTYVKFLSRTMQIVKYIHEEYGILLTPRQLDAFLLKY